MKKTIILAIAGALLTSASAQAGAFGAHVYNCVSDSLRTHVEFRLNDADYGRDEYKPKKISITVMGATDVLDGAADQRGLEWQQSLVEGNLVDIETVDGTYLFQINTKRRTAVVKRADNPRRDGKELRNLSLRCNYWHDL